MSEDDGWRVTKCCNNDKPYINTKNTKSVWDGVVGV